MDAVLVTPSCCDPLCRRAVRVSMGTVFQVPWAQIGTCPADWPENGSAQLHALGFKTAAMALSDRSVSIDDPALAAEPKLAIVLGTEAMGWPIVPCRLRLHRKDSYVPWGRFPQRSRRQRRSLLAAWPLVSPRLCSPKLLDKRPKTRYTISVIIMAYSSVGSASVAFPIWCYSSFAPIQNWVLFCGPIAQLGAMRSLNNLELYTTRPQAVFGGLNMGS